MKINVPLIKPVVSNPKILSGTPVIQGTRIPASLVFDLFRRGYSIDIIKTEYPSLTRQKLNDFMKLMSSCFNETTKEAV